MRRRMLWAFKFCIFVLAFLIFTPTAIALEGWTKTYQGESMDILTPSSATQTVNGGYVLAVNAYVRRVDNVGYQGHFTQFQELQIIKIASTGDIEWKRDFTKIEDPNQQTPILVNDRKCIIVQTSDEGYVIAGSSTDYFWMFKANSQGNILWVKTYIYNYDAPSNSYLYSLIQTNDGGFALAGSTVTDEGSNDFWLVKTDSKGNLQWNQTYNSGTNKNPNGNEFPREDEAKSIVQTSDGGYILAGSASLYRASTDSIVYASWVVKTDSQGKQLWNKGYDLPNDHSYDYIIIQTADGGYALAGTQNHDFCLLKIDSASQLQWTKTYGDAGERAIDIPCGLAQLSDGGYAIAGTWTKINSTATAMTMGLLRLDSAGQTVWIKTYTAKQNSTTISYDQANAMILTSDGAYAVVGSTQFGSETHQDVFFVKTETLEQPPQKTPLLTPTTSNPVTTQNPTQTTQPTSSPIQPGQTQAPSNSNPNNSNLPQNPTPSETSTQEPNETITASESPTSSTTILPQNTTMTQDSTIYIVIGTVIAIIATITIILIIKRK